MERIKQKHRGNKAGPKQKTKVLLTGDANAFACNISNLGYTAHTGL
jgi:hypothetical protein